MAELERVVLHLDELEALRLCDQLDLDQEQAGVRMGISRGIVQRLLASARHKVADALVSGKALAIIRPDHVELHPHYGRHRHGQGMADKQGE